MFRFDKSKSVEKERSRHQIVVDAYTHLWDLFWLPITFLSELFWQSKLFPLHWIQLLFGARIGRWPEKIDYPRCTKRQCQTCRTLQSGELDIDNEEQITHDPFDILSKLKRRTTS